MGKVRSLTAISLLATLLAAVVVALAGYLDAFESLGAWIRQLQPWQFDGLLAVFVVLTVALGFYGWRKRSQLLRQATRHEREVGELEGELAKLRYTREALERDAATYRGVIADLPVALFAVDPEGVFTLTEGTGLDLLGLEPARVVGRSIFETYRNAPQVVECVRLALGGQASGATVEVGGRAFETRYSPLRENGEFSGVLGVAIDVTGRRRAEDRLREAEARYRTLVEQIPAITYVEELSRNGKVLTYMSPQYEAFLGYSPVEGVPHPKHWIEVVHPEDRERVLAEDRRTDESLEPFRAEYRMIGKDARIVWVSDEAVLVRDESGEPLFWQGVILDITERKRAEEALKRSEEYFRSLVQNASDIVSVLGADGTVRYVSPAIEKVLGYLPEERVGRSSFELLHPDDLSRVKGAFAEALRSSGANLAFEVRIRHRDGSWRQVEVAATNLLDNPSVSGIVLNWRDVTERKRAEEQLQDAEARYRTLVEQIPAVTYIDLADDPETSLYTSPQIEKMLGYTPEEWRTNRMWIKSLHPEDRERILAADEPLEKRGEPFSEEYRLLAKDGSVVWVREEAQMVRDEEGKSLYLQGVMLDITERKRAEEALKESEAILAEAQRLAHVGSWDWDVVTGEVRWSDEVFRIYGFEPGTFTPTLERMLEVVHPVDRDKLRSDFDAVLYRGEPYDFEYRIVRPGGEVRVVHRRAEVLRANDGEPLKMVGTVHDITERKALEAKLEHQALHDPLTGLPNRTLFMDRLRQALSRAKRRKREVVVLFMDLDNFKVINDSLGHKTGDTVLVAASKRVRRALRPEDTVARLGGDELIVLLEGIDVTAAVHATERVQQRLQIPISVGGRRLFVSASVGIAIGGVNGKQAADLLRDADLAMYQAKRSGKARYAVFEEEMNTRAIERLELEHDLRQALKRGEFRVYYQPQMLLDADLQRHLGSVGSRAVVAGTATQAPRIAGMEALVRWVHPERGLLLPDDFIPLAEETGLIVDIGELVLAEACRKTKEWQARFPAELPLAVCVNLSARQFREPNLTKTIRRILSETELDPTCLHIEITESTAMGDAPATVATLAEVKELKELGVRIAIDDFGTGYSSLSYLEHFPVDYVKIDHSFVGKLGDDAGATALISGMIRLAHSLGLKVIAEGVETEDQLKRLQGLGCDLAQGHYFSEAIPAEAVGSLLKSNTPGT